MNATTHQVADRSMNHAMTLDRILPGERGGDYGDFVMATFFGPSMTGMQVRLIVDGERLRFKRRQSFAQQRPCFGAQADSAFLKGLTVTLA